MDFTGNDFWKNYMVKWFGEDLIEKWEKYANIDVIESNNQFINLEVYNTGKSDATTIIFAHGIAGYARILLPFIMPLFEKGYNFVIPDMQGFGYNDGLKGDFEWNIHKQNLKDTIKYARSKFNGKIVLGGASMGGPLAYAAACESDEIDALICWCLWDFNDKEFIYKETTTKRLTFLLIPIFKLLSKVLRKFRIKTYKLVSYDTLSDSKIFNDMVKKDPQAGRFITLRGASSLITQSKPFKRHEDFWKPVLVVQPELDNMTPKYYTEKTFKKIGSENKKYIEIKGSPHFPLYKDAYDIWSVEVDDFLKNIVN